MPARFADAALALAGLVPRLLGWRPDEFWAATPAELAAILAPDAAAQGDPLSRHEFDTLMERECDGR